MITYSNIKDVVSVFLDGRHIGDIYQQFSDGFQFFTKRSKHGGEVFTTLCACKDSVEESHREQA